MMTPISQIDRSPRALLRALAIVLVAAVMSSAAPAAAGPNTAEAEKLFDAGQYKPAERLFESELEREPDNGRALLGLAEVYARTGRYELLGETLEKAAKHDDVANRARVMRAEHLVRTGAYEKAIKTLEDVVDDDPGNLRALVRLGETYLLVGEKNKGDRTMNAFAQLFNKGKAETAEDLVYVGVAMHATDSFEDANYVFSEAIAKDSKHIDAYLRAGELFLEKYNYRDADNMFRKALEIDSKHPRALVGMARTAIDSDRAYDEARDHLKKALEVNPVYVPAIHVLAEMELTDEMPDAALERLEKAAEINPKQLHTLALQAAAHYLADENKKQKKKVETALEINERYADVYVTIGQFAELHNRFEEAIAFYEQALEIDRSHWRAYVGLGLSYARSGNDEKAYEYLDKAYRADPYNVRAYNLVELYDRTLKNYEWHESDNMRFRFNRSEQDLLALYVPPLMEGAYNLFERKYDFTPDPNLSIELFSDSTSFGVRSLGVPVHPGIQGLCFGKVVTSRTPGAKGTANWAMTLWHELAHVFHLQMSNARVPRWFTEGLAEYETVLARKEWQREHEIEIWIALQKENLYGVDDLNYGFTHADNLNAIVVAYYQATLVVEYIDIEYGFDKLPEMLRAWGEKKSQDEVFEGVLGVTTEEFDEGFRAWLKKRFSYLEGTYELDLNSYVVNHDDYLEAAEAAPDDAEAVAHAGLAKLFRLDVDAARARLEKALSLDPDSPTANYLGGIIALREGAYEDAKKYYTHLVELGYDGYTIQSELAYLHLKMGKTDDAVRHYEKAKSYYPRGAEPYAELSKLYLSQDKDRKARKELEVLLELNEDDFSVAATLLKMAIEAGEYNDAREYGQTALDIDPFQPETHLQMAKVGIQQQDWLLAEREYKAYLVLEPGSPFDAYVGLAEVYVELGQAGAARDYLERARATKPNDPAVSRIESKLDRL